MTMGMGINPLSDLLGAEEFETLLAREGLRRSRTAEPLTVAVLDVDGLRRINARQGAATGGEVLRLCADALRETLRAVDEIARTGPDEFSVLLHATDAKSASRWADRFEDAFERAGEEQLGAPLTCSLGLADTGEEPTVMQVAATARRRMEVIQTVRKLRRAREGGS